MLIYVGILKKVAVKKIFPFGDKTYPDKFKSSQFKCLNLGLIVYLKWRQLRPQISSAVWNIISIENCITYCRSKALISAHCTQIFVYVYYICYIHNSVCVHKNGKKRHSIWFGSVLHTWICECVLLDNHGNNSQSHPTYVHSYSCSYSYSIPVDYLMKLLILKFNAEMSHWLQSSQMFLFLAPCAVQSVLSTLNCSANALTVSWEAAPVPVHYNATAVDVGGTTLSCMTEGSGCTIASLTCGRRYTVTVRATGSTCEGHGSVPETVNSGRSAGFPKVACCF